MNILFINQHTGSRTVPLASACLASALEARFETRVKCRLLELPPEFSPDKVAQEIHASTPDLVAMTIYTWSRVKLVSLAAVLSQLNPEGTVIVGGPEVTADPSKIQACTGIDLAVAGEGEEAITSIVGKMLEESGKTDFLASFRAPLYAPVITDLDNLPTPWDAGLLQGGEWDDYVWELTRGCPFSCHFCFESKGSGKVRHKSLARAEEELAQLQEQGAERVFLLDPTFNAPPKRAVELLELFIRMAPEISWHLEVRSEFLDEKQAERYAELGCVLQIGLQSSDETVARNIGRPFSRDDFSDKVMILHEYGVAYGLDLIWGLPGDSLDGFRQSLNFALSCIPNHLDMFPLAVLPGTRLRDEAEALRLPYRQEPPYTVQGSSSFPEEDQQEAAVLAETVNALYNRSRAVTWFPVVCDTLEISPIEFVDSAAEYGFTDEGINEADRPALLTGLIRKIAETRLDESIVSVLTEMLALLTIGSAAAENIPIPDDFRFTCDPVSLMDHLEMGISDPQEIAAFVRKAPGMYKVLLSEGGLEFQLK